MGRWGGKQRAWLLGTVFHWETHAQRTCCLKVIAQASAHTSSSQRPSQAATTPGGSKSYFPSLPQSPASALNLLIQVLVSLPPK